jgi:transcriptional regulator with XRE-family HTH domain
MGRKRGIYTPLGEKIARLAENQAELAEVLDLTQQSISGKLTGKIAVTLKDLERLAEHYDVPTIYFLGPDHLTPEQARGWARVLDGPPEVHQAMQMACDLPAPFMHELLHVVEAMRSTAGYCQNNQTPYPPYAAMLPPHAYMPRMHAMHFAQPQQPGMPQQGQAMPQGQPHVPHQPQQQPQQQPQPQQSPQEAQPTQPQGGPQVPGDNGSHL